MDGHLSHNLVLNNYKLLQKSNAAGCNVQSLYVVLVIVQCSSLKEVLLSFIQETPSLKPEQMIIKYAPETSPNTDSHLGASKRYYYFHIFACIKPVID